MTDGMVSLALGIIGIGFVIGLALTACAYTVESVRQRGLTHRLMFVAAVALIAFARSEVDVIQRNFARAGEPRLQPSSAAWPSLLAIGIWLAITVVVLVFAFRTMRWALRPVESSPSDMRAPRA